MATGIINHVNDSGWIDCRGSKVTAGTLEYRVKDGIFFLRGDSIQYTATAKLDVTIGSVPFAFTNYPNFFARHDYAVCAAWFGLNGDIHLICDVANPAKIAIFFSMPMELEG